MRMLLMLVLVLLSLGTWTHADAAPPTAVEIRTFTFTPARLEVAVGTTVSWRNDDDSPHQVTTRDGSLRSSVLDTGQSFSFRFTRAGTYAYYCSLHPHMQGVVVVH